MAGPISPLREPSPLVSKCILRCRSVTHTISGHCDLDLWPSFKNVCVRSISLIFFEVGIPKLVCICILGWWSLTYYFQATVTLTSDQVLIIIVSGAYLLYYLRRESQIWCVWMHLGMVECLLPFTGHCDLDLWPSFNNNCVRSISSFIIWDRNPKFGVWMHLEMVEGLVPFTGHCDLDLWPSF